MKTGLAVLVVVLSLALPALAEDLRHGEKLLTDNCGSCHEALVEGTMSGHPEMPELSFEADDVSDIIAYLKSIQR